MISRLVDSDRPIGLIVVTKQSAVANGIPGEDVGAKLLPLGTVARGVGHALQRPGLASKGLMGLRLVRHSGKGQSALRIDYRAF